ncbi:MAG: NAD(P)/FAD-dependent oxidoreductase [Bacteroidetes bacterium]|nr:MAG: NAD(P)/FAD-dependent oxidoreductase [Bacteroidota bacterium]
MDAFCRITEAICLPKSEFPRIVIIGGGFAGLALVENLKKEDLQIVLIDRNNFHQFQPLYYQVATSALEPDSIVFPFRKQLRGYKNVIFRLAEVQEVQSSDNTVYTDNGFLTYDFLVLATGSETNFFGMERIAEHGLGLKDIRDSLDIRHKMLQNLEQAAITCNDEERDALTNFVVVGGGPAGVETAGALAEFRNYILPKDYPEYPAFLMNIYLVEASGRVLSSMSKNASAMTLKYLKNLNVEVLLNETVVDYDGNVVLTKGGEKYFAKTLIWTAGVKGQFPDGIGKKNVVKGNRIKTNAFLKVEGYENVFAIGDVATVISETSPEGHPQVAQPAIQQGVHLSAIIRNLLHGKPIKPFKYKDKGSLATIGKRKAVADLGRFKFGGYFAWMIWSFVHLISIIGFRNKLLVGINWLISYFSFDKGSRIIIRPFKKERLNTKNKI